MSNRLEAAVAELVEALAEVARVEAASVPAAPDRLLSVAEACQATSLGRTAIYELIAAGKLRSITIGRRRLIPASEVGRIAGLAS
jgi:excisionase family DNA binding protein